MKPVYQLKHTSQTRLENNYPYHLLDRDTRLFPELLQLVLLLLNLRFLDRGIRLFSMMGLSRLLYLQKKRVCIGMYSWYSHTLRPTVLGTFAE